MPNRGVKIRTRINRPRVMFKEQHKVFSFLQINELTRSSVIFLPSASQNHRHMAELLQVLSAPGLLLGSTEAVKFPLVSLEKLAKVGFCEGTEAHQRWDVA